MIDDMRRFRRVGDGRMGGKSLEWEVACFSRVLGAIHSFVAGKGVFIEILSFLSSFETLDSVSWISDLIISFDLVVWSVGTCLWC